MRRSWRMEAKQDAPGAARDELREFLTGVGGSGRCVQDVLLCVSEAVTNVVMHAYRAEAQAGHVEIEALAESGVLLLTVRDAGGGFFPRSDSPGAGLGMGIINALTRSCEIRPTADGGTEIVMRFALE